MKKTSVLILLLTLISALGSLSAKRAGGESTTFKKLGAGRAAGIVNNKGLQLKQFQSVIDLHRGYAVVRDEYVILKKFNTSVDVTFRFPSEGSFNMGILDTVQYRNWSVPEIQLNGRKIPIDSVKLHPVKELYTWKAIIRNDTTRIVLHYIVNTHDAVLRKHFDVEHSFGFCYVLEPLQSWKTTIPKVKILIHLPYLLNEKWIDGILPEKSFKINGRYLTMSRKHVDPSELQNIIVRYGKTDIYSKKDDFYFPSVLVNKEKLFDRTDLLSAQLIDTSGFKTFDKAEFEPAPVAFFSISGIVIVFALLGLGIVILVVWAIIAQYKNMR